MSPRVTVYTRSGCGLGPTAAGAVVGFGGGGGGGGVAVDGDADPELRAEYGDRVPVIAVDGREHGCFRVEEPRLRRALTG